VGGVALEGRKEWFRDFLIDWVQSNRKTSFDQLQPDQQSKEFTRCYVKEVISKLTPGLVPDDPDDIDEFLVDGPNDGGADFIYRSDGDPQGRVLIIQSKYRGRGKSEDPKELVSFAEILKRLYDASRGKKRFNRKVMEAISDIDWASDYFDMRFCTFGKTNDAMTDRAEQGPALIGEFADMADRVELALLDETELNKSLREALSADKEPDRPVSIRFTPNEEGRPWIRYESEEGRELYIGQVSGAELSEIYKRDKYKLFTMNIRDYVGDTGTNRGIVETAKAKPDDFIFFNNGVSAIATDVREDEKDPAVLHCERFSIINGAQTVRSLRKAHERNPDPVRKVKVMLRIMQFRFSKDAEFLADVTRYNNTQNSIKISDFRSNDPVQKDLRNKFAKISVGAKTCDYKNKRRREPDSNKFPIGMEDFAKTVHSFIFGPDDMSGGTKYLFDTSAKGGYIKVFGEPVSKLSEDRFEYLAGIYFLCHQVESLWKERREAEGEEGPSSPALERRWIVFYTIGELLRMIYAARGFDLDADLRFLSNPNKWITVKNSYTLAAVEEVFSLAATALTQAYGKVSDDPDFRHRNWFRNTKTLQDIKNELSVIPKYRKSDDLPLLREHLIGAKSSTSSSIGHAKNR
jgi:hypothetical protein